jgi:4-amino-4-deoxy-L-arabinose transferase-like glycosyltransferase
MATSAGRHLVPMVAAAALLLFLGLDGSTIWDANEAYYVETPRQMVQSADYVNPSFNGQPRFNKPVLSYWVVSAFYKVFGVSVWAQRVAIAIGALGIAAAAFILGRLMWSARAGWIAALVLLTAPRVVFFARRIFIDIYITLFMSFVLVFFALAEARPSHRRRYLLLMYAAAGLGVLTKGPLAVVLPAMAFVVYLAVQRRLRDIPRMYPLTGALIVLAIVAPWYLMVYAEHGWDYIRTFFIDENLGRYADTFGEQSRPFYFYGPVLLTELFPWSLFVPAALWVAWKTARRQAESHHSGGATTPALARLLLSWVAVIVLVFSFSRTKQDLYIFPIVAALAALIAGLFEQAINGDEPAARWAHRTWPIVAVLMVALWIMLQRLFGSESSPYYIRGAVVVGILLLAGAVTLLAPWRRRSTLDAILAVGLALILANYVLVFVSLPYFERFKPVAPLSAVARQRNPAAHVVQFRTPLPSMVWYLGKPIEEVYDLPVLQQRFAREGETLVLLKEGDYDEVRSLGSTCIIARHPLLDVKPREIMAGTALPQMLLVSNRCEGGQ